jgi:hypothetical protein
MPQISLQEAIKKNLKSGHIHTILIPKEFGLDEAKKWLKSHGYKIRHRSTTNVFRFNQVPEIIGARFGSKRLPNGVILVFQYY